MNDESRGLWKAAVLVYFKALHGVPSSNKCLLSYNIHAPFFTSSIK
jgi:hypothetical protein